ncbi:MAG TPA: hypothetical protein VER96_02005 [Polyangiaceae bacterium]|nr:hypothetical protein [Polyangiaceae bacterium]
MSPLPWSHSTERDALPALLRQVHARHGNAWCGVNEEIKLLRAIQGSARASGGEPSGRVSFRLSRSPEARWRELFDAGKGDGVSTEERGAEFLLHIEVKPGEVASRRDALQTLITDVNNKRRTELMQQAELTRERTENKRNIEDALNRELEALRFE